MSLPFPPYLQIELTNNCNLKCSMCPRQKMTYPIGFMKIELAKKIIAQCINKPVILKLFFLGESMLHPQLREILYYAHHCEVRAFIITNGTLINNENAEWLLRYCSTIGVSMDSVDSPVFNSERIGAKFDKIVENVQLLCQKKKTLNINTGIVIVTMPKNHRALKQILNFWKSFDVSVSPILRFDWRAPSKKNWNHPCSEGLNSLVIRWDGKTTFCCGDINMRNVIGNANKLSIEQLWSCQRLNNIRFALCFLKFDAVEACRFCSVQQKKISYTGLTKSQKEILLR